MHINVPLFIDTLFIMLKGMIGIFAVTVVIMLIIFILNKISSKKSRDQNEE